jgi:superfamily II DNA/RNA helicase
MRNIKRVVLWGLPPSFCALVQRAGRAARDLRTSGEAILIVPPSVIKKGISELDVEQTLQDVQPGSLPGAAEEYESRNYDVGVILPYRDNNRESGPTEAAGVELTSGNEEVLVNDGGVRVAQDSDEEGEDEEQVGKVSRRKTTAKNYNSREALYLTLFTCGRKCRRAVWDEFFGNNKKCA